MGSLVKGDFVDKRNGILILVCSVNERQEQGPHLLTLPMYNLRNAETESVNYMT
jgi:hypothetical protein